MKSTPRVEPPPSDTILKPEVCAAFEAALKRGLDRVRAGGAGLYAIRFELGIPDVQARVVLERVKIKLSVKRGGIIKAPPPRRLV